MECLVKNKWEFYCLLIIPLLAIVLPLKIVQAEQAGKLTIGDKVYDVFERDSAQPVPPAVPPGTQPATVPATSPVVVVTPATSPVVAAKPAPSKPDASSTGPIPGTLFKASGSISATAGKVIENLTITGTIDAKGLAPVIRNCRIDAGGSTYAIKNANGVTVEDCEIFNFVTCAIDASRLTIRNSHFHDAGQDALKVGDNSTIEGSYFTRLGTQAGSHADAIQIRGGQNIKILRCNFATDNGTGFNSNSPIFIQGASKPAGNITIDDCDIAGGNYGVRPYTDGGDPTSIKVTNNRFKLGTFRYGCGHIESGVVWTNNVDSVTRKAVTPGSK